MNVEHAIEELQSGCSRYVSGASFYELLDVIRADAWDAGEDVGFAYGYGTASGEERNPYKVFRA